MGHDTHIPAATGGTQQDVVTDPNVMASGNHGGRPPMNEEVRDPLEGLNGASVDHLRRASQTGGMKLSRVAEGIVESHEFRVLSRPGSLGDQPAP
ncbi:MAG TPA: hypothetical protein VFH70_11285 [Acidimicrobiales bacterium]|nr:hypothetical protein [Acidimicrobiales bacterium]